MDEAMLPSDSIVDRNDLVLITGAAGFIGPKLLKRLLGYGLTNIRCLVRPSSNTTELEQAIAASGSGATVELLVGNLLRPEDCARAVAEARVIFHLAAGRGEKSYADAFLNSVVTTRNLLDAAVAANAMRRFVTVSSFSVYSNRDKQTGRVLDETCPLEDRPAERGDAYTFAKTKQDELVAEYRERYNVPAVVIRPGVVYGPGNEAISGRVGLATFGLFLHFGGNTPVPLTYVENCADAIALAGLTPGIDGEVFNVVDDDLPSSRNFLRRYKRAVKPFPSLYAPPFASYLFCYLWEKYSAWSQGQLPPVFNRRTWHAYWKRTTYTNAKLRQRLKWRPAISTQAGLERFFASCRDKLAKA